MPGVLDDCTLLQPTASLLQRALQPSSLLTRDTRHCLANVLTDFHDLGALAFEPLAQGRIDLGVVRELDVVDTTKESDIVDFEFFTRGARGRDEQISDEGAPELFRVSGRGGSDDGQPHTWHLDAHAIAEIQDASAPNPEDLSEHARGRDVGEVERDGEVPRGALERRAMVRRAEANDVFERGSPGELALVSICRGNT